jgi:Leucine-rich repeat (LRR) protein
MSRYSIFEIPNGENVSSSMVSRSFPLKFNFLNTLDISFNKIITVKKVPAVLSLKYLYLDYNELEAARDNAFQSLLGLKVLSLVGNNLKTLHPHTLPLDSLFIELQEIRLDKNPWRCDCNMKWLLKDVTDVSGFRNFTLK